MLASRLGSFDGLRVADLFAGSGALGLEALSRGAAHCTFIEKDRVALDSLRSNISKLGAAEIADVRAQSVEHFSPPEAFDLVLMDPPYGTKLAQTALDRMVSKDWLSPGAWISVELSGETLEIAPPLQPDAERRFGKAKIILIRNGSQALSPKALFPNRSL